VGFGHDVVGFAIFQTKIRGRATIDFRAVLGKTGFSLFRFQIDPIKGQGGNIEQFGIILLVHVVLFF
jgi:predicted rRNA methylase YqxC with S4 and FtsJ domains